MSTDKSHLTAISRKSPSLPTRHIWERYHPLLLNSFVLDFGCGRGEDVRWLRSKNVYVKGYDPYYAPERPSGTFSVALCHYVLNVVDPNDVHKVVAEVLGYLKKHGIAFFTVRRDIKKEGFTKKGTQQWNVNLPFQIEKETRDFCIYKVRKD